MDKWDESAAKAWAAILTKVRALDKGGETLEGIAKLLGIKNRGSISLWLSGGRKAENTSFPNMLRYLERLGLDYSEFLPPSAPTIQRMGVHSPVEIVEGDDLTPIPIVGEAGAGTPAEFFNCAPESWIPVLPPYFFPGVRAFKVVGDSMEPTIMKGAHVGVVPFTGRLTEGGIYLVEDPDFGLVVKRVRKDRGGTIMLFSDNPKWEPIPMPYEGYDNVIAGEVCWVWQLLR